MVVATKAIVFSAIKYSEADLIVSCFTETAGIKSYLLRNIMKTRKGKLKASFFQPLTQLELIAEHKNKGTLEYIKEATNNELFVFLENAFQWLDGHDEVANFHIFFLLQLSMYLGFYPDATAIEKNYFNIVEGNFQETNTSNYCVDGERVENFKYFFKIDFETLSTVKISKHERKELLELMLAYYSFHVQGYQKPKSLAVLNQLFS